MFGSLHPIQERRPRQGLALVVLILLFPVMIGMLSAGLDVGFLYTSKAWYQGVADMAVLTAVACVDYTATYSTEDAIVRQRVQQSAVANGLAANFFTVATIKNPGTDDLLLARVTARYTSPLFFAGVLGLTSARTGILASAEVVPGQIGYRGGNVALFGELLVDANGNVFIDSFNSGDGPYSPINTGADGRPYAKANATVAGNGDADINGNISFHGDLFFGDDVSITGTGGFITGSVLCGGTIDAPPTAISGYRIGGFNVPPFNPAPATLPSGLATSNDNYRITGYVDYAALSSQSKLQKGTGGGEKVIYLPAGGRYYFTSVEIQSDVRLELQGDPSSAGETIIYMDGPMKIVGGVFNGGSQPKAADLRIVSVVSTPMSAPIVIGGNSTVYADVYAPMQKFTLDGGGTLVGRIFGKELDLQGNTTIHYDETLKPIDGGVLVERIAKRSPHLVE